MTNQINYQNLTLPITTIIAVILEQLKHLPTTDHPDKPGHATYLAIMAQTTEQLTRPNQTLDDLKTISKIVAEQRRAESRFHQRPTATTKTAEKKKPKTTMEEYGIEILKPEGLDKLVRYPQEPFEVRRPSPYLADLIRQLWGLKGWDPYRINPEYPNPIQGKHPTERDPKPIPPTDPKDRPYDLKAPTLPVKEFREAAKKIYGPDWNPCIDYEVMDAYLEKQKAKEQSPTNQSETEQTQQPQPEPDNKQRSQNERSQCNTQEL